MAAPTCPDPSSKTPDQFDGWTAEENESLVNWDYAAQEMILNTTKRTVWNSWLKKVNGLEGVKILPRERTIKVPMKYACASSSRNCHERSPNVF